MATDRKRLLRWQAGRVRWEPVRLLIADSDPLFSSGLRALLAQMGDMDITGEATSGAEAVLLAEETIPDILLLDATLADSVKGTDVARQVLGQNPHIGIVLLMETEDPELVFRGMRAGARGYVVKGASPQTLRRRIKAAFRGEVILSPVVTKTLLDRLRGARRSVTGRLNSPPITERERQVLQLGANGLSNKEVAGELGLSDKTVRNHMNNIFVKLRAHDRTQAVLAALREGLITLPEEDED